MQIGLHALGVGTGADPAMIGPHVRSTLFWVATPVRRGPVIRRRQGCTARSVGPTPGGHRHDIDDDIAPGEPNMSCRSTVGSQWGGIRTTRSPRIGAQSAVVVTRPCSSPKNA